MKEHNKQKQHRRFEDGEKVAKISLVCMIFLTVIKGYAGIVYLSVAVLADAINSLSDIFASALVGSGLRLAGKKPDEKFPYGYYRGETLASLVVSGMIVFSGIEIMIESVRRYFEPIQIIDGTIPLIASAISAITYYLLARYKSKVGKRINSRSLIADSKHSTIDVYAGILVFIGVTLSIVGLSTAEVIVAVLIALYIIKEGIEIGRDSVFSLMDASPQPEKVEEIKTIAHKVPGVLDIHSIRLRRSGPVYFLEAHITVIRDITVQKGHTLSEVIEEKIKESIPEIETATLHIEPEKEHRLRIAVPVIDASDESSQVESHFERVLVLAVADLEGGRIRNLHFLENLGDQEDWKKGQHAISLLAEEGVDALVVGSIGQYPFEILRSHFMTLYKLPKSGMNLSEVLSCLISEELDILNRPSEEAGYEYND